MATTARFDDGGEFTSADYDDPLVWPDHDAADESEPEDGYQIVDDADIDRLLRWRRERVERITAAEERAAKMRHEIDEWLDAETGADRRNVDQLDGVIRLHLEADGRRSFSSPFGRVTSRKAIPVLALDLSGPDRATHTIDALEAIDPRLINRSMRNADVKRALRPARALDGEQPDEAPAINPATGEIVPGLTFRTGGRTWTIK